MVLIAPFQKIVKVIVIIRSVLQLEIFSKGFSHVVYLTVFSFVFFKGSTVDDGQFLELSDRSESDISVAHQLVEWVVLEV